MNVDGKEAVQKRAIRVFVVDDHPMVRHGVADMLRAERDMHCVGDAGDGDETVKAAPAAQPHVVVMNMMVMNMMVMDMMVMDVMVMDMRMPRMDGIGALQALRPLLPNTRFVLLALRVAHEATPSRYPRPCPCSPKRRLRWAQT